MRKASCTKHKRLLARQCSNDREGLLIKRIRRHRRTPARGREVMARIGSSFLLFALAQVTFSAVLPEYSIQITERSRTAVTGSFVASSTGPNALSWVGVRFNIRDHPDGSSEMTLQRPGNGDNLLHFKWSHNTDGEVQLDEHRVLDKTFSGTPPSQLTDAEKQAESKAFGQLRRTAEYRVLPVMSKTLGKKYNVTGFSMRSAFVFHKFALDAEKAHNTLAELEGRATPNHVIRRRKRYPLESLNPWGKDNTFNCNSPSGKCSNHLLDYDYNGDCNGRGIPIPPSMYPKGCTGMCGPGCYRCWTWICRDCCAHPGCDQHDRVCAKGYHQIGCWTGKGVLYGNTLKQTC